MFIFLYKAARHSTDRWNNRNRYKQDTKRGDFNLELLRKGIKNRYSILPHSEYPFQNELAKVDLQEELYGHIVSIEEAKNAIWFKLNYDQVGKGSTKYVGSWKDLDPAAIQTYVEDYTRLKSEHANVTSVSYTLRYQVNRAEDFRSGVMRSKDVLGDSFDDLDLKTYEYKMLVSDHYNKLEKKASTLREEMVALQTKVKEYMDSRKF
jgi:hypothetical protein